VEVTELRAGRALDREGFGTYLAAHLALERATARRVLLAHLAALGGIPAWTCLLVPVSHALRTFSVWGFAVALAAFLASLASEASHRAALRDAEQTAPIRGIDTD